ncbi:cupredoxin family protein [Ramlibacter terrae]|uniref:Cupredoxin family protein n=1 Tax=Ramlibacter terrae TaxID=2732511 RepID=A0ABX6P537_9BURK|nr:cupredoxin family protein [Ramlibacter terrae]
MRTPGSCRSLPARHRSARPACPCVVPTATAATEHWRTHELRSSLRRWPAPAGWWFRRRARRQAFGAPDVRCRPVEATPFGQEGDPKRVTRTIRVGMNDRMRFDPATINVRKGETVRFVVANRGAVLHEMVLGTAQALKEHAEMMKKHPGMEHDEPSMAHVKPGATGDIVWQFTQSGEFQFACLVPGHFEAGMVGTLVVR